MSGRSRYRHILGASKHEARIAVDFYNRSTGQRNLEAFIVHMSIAWLYLAHAILTRDKVDYRYWETHGKTRRLVKEDGEPKTWELKRCIRELYPNEDDPVRRNVEFFIPLRNVVEHRYAPLVEPIVAGRVQSLILNFEAKLIAEFGPSEGLSDSLRFPIFLSTLTGDAAQALKRAYKRLPLRITNFISRYDAELPEEVRNHPNYEMRVYLLPKVGPRTEADVAIEFVRIEELSSEERAAIDKATVIIRDRHQAVRFEDCYKASEVTKAVASAIPWKFSLYGHHTPAWKHFKVRPEAGAVEPARTDEKYCVYDRAHKDYVYTRPWIDKLIRELNTTEGFRAVTGHEPIPKVG